MNTSVINFGFLVEKELNRIRAKHLDQKVNSYHEGYALLLEEVDEFWEEVRKKASARDPVNTLKELVQIGALAQRIAEDINIVRDARLEGKIDPKTGRVSHN